MLRHSFLRVVLTSTALALGVSAPLAAQSARTATLVGVVSTTPDRVVGHVPLIVQSEAGDLWPVTASFAGVFRLTLPPGCYSLAVDDYPPYQPIQVVVVLRPGLITEVAIPLERIRYEETIRVDPPRLLSRTLEGAFGVSVTRQEIEGLPSPTGLTLQSALSRTPGIITTEQTGAHTQFSSHGLRRDENSLWVDKFPLTIGTDPTGGAAGPGLIDRQFPYAHDGSTKTVLPWSAIAAFHIMTANVPSSYRRSPGAQAQIVTVAGGDTRKGSAFFDRRIDGWSADDYFLRDRRIRFSNGGAGLGGPIVRERLHYHLSFESERIARPVPMTAAVPSDSLRESASSPVREILDGYPRSNGRDLGNGQAEYHAVIPADSDLDVWSVRLDGVLSPRHRITGRVTDGRSRGDEVDPILLQPRSFFTLAAATRTTHASFTVNSVLSSRTVHEGIVTVGGHQTTVRSGTARHGGAHPLPVAALLPAGVSPANGWTAISLTLGGLPAFINHGVEGDSRQEQIYVKSTWTLHRGAHVIGLGGDLRHGVTAADPANDWLNYKLGSLTQFFQQRAALVTIERVEDTRVRQRVVAAYVEDVWRVSPRLTLRGGVRWDVRPAPTSVTAQQPFVLDAARLADGLHARLGPLWRTSYTNLAPQVSATVQLGRNTAVAGGAGLTWGDLTAPGALAFRGFPFAVTGAVKGTLPLPADSLRLGPSTPDMAREFIILPDNLRRPRVYDWNAGLEQGVGRVQLFATYVGTAGRDLPYAYRQYLGEFGQQWGNGFTNDGRSDYHALHMGGRLVWDRLSAQMSYSRSWAFDNQSGEGFRYRSGPTAPPTLVDPDSNWGASDNSRPHVLNVAVSCQLPPLRGPQLVQHLFRDWQVSAVGRIQSGPAFSVVVPQNLGDGFFEYRPDLVQGEPLWVPSSTSPDGRRLNPYAFSAPSRSTESTQERNSLRGRPVGQLDLVLAKLVRAGGMTATLRLNAYNILNTLNWGPPYNNFATAGADTVPRFGEPFQSNATALGSGTLTGGGLVSVRQFGGARSLHATFEVKF